MISVFGSTGFIGNRFCEMYPNKVIRIGRESRQASSQNILYLISTTHNYPKRVSNSKDYNYFSSVFGRISDPLQIAYDVYTNLQVLSEVLENLVGNYNVLNFCSSWFVCAKAYSPVSEQTYFDPPTGNYSFTKWQAEQLVQYYCTQNKIPYRIFRLANVFGQGDKFSAQKNAFQYLVNEMKNNRDIGLYYGGKFYRDYIWVDDVCAILNEGMKILPVNEIYHVGWGEPILFLDMIGKAHQMLGSKSKIYEKEPPEFHYKVQVKDFWFNTKKIEDYGLFATDPIWHIKDIL